MTKHPSMPGFRTIVIGTTGSLALSKTTTGTR